jgi:hypothetical protein
VVVGIFIFFPTYNFRMQSLFLYDNKHLSESVQNSCLY